jgi:hypothetical protein
LQLTSQSLTTMILRVAAASLFLRSLTASATGGQLASVAHVDAISMELERMSAVNLKDTESASHIALQAGELSGYAVFATYIDSECSALGYAVIYPLNTCFIAIARSGVLNGQITATSTSYIATLYSDDTCMTTDGSPVETPYTSECTAGEITLVQPSKQPPTTEPTVSFR